MQSFLLTQWSSVANQQRHQDLVRLCPSGIFQRAVRTRSHSDWSEPMPSEMLNILNRFGHVF